MKSRRESGESLVEVVIAVAAIAIVTGAGLAASVNALHRLGPDPIQDALTAAAHREMRIAVDILKYQGGTIQTTTVATSVPVAGATAIPAHLSVSASPAASGGISIVLSATSDLDASKSASVQTTIAHPVPIPSSTIFVPSGAPAPTGAP